MRRKERRSWKRFLLLTSCDPGCDLQQLILVAILSIFGSGNSPKSIEVLDSECSSRHPGLDCPPLKALGEIVRGGCLSWSCHCDTRQSDEQVLLQARVAVHSAFPSRCLMMNI